MTAEGPPLADDFHIGDRFQFGLDLFYKDCLDTNRPMEIVWSNVIGFVEASTIKCNTPLKA